MRAGLIIGLLVVVAAAAQRAAADDAAVGASCPGYVTGLMSAREALGAGDRDVALGALRRAERALAACLREGTSETALAAARGDGPRG